MIDQDVNFRRLYLDGGDKVCSIVLENLLALIAYSKRPLNNSEKLIPMLYLQVQLWQRELSGILRYFQKNPEFTWRHSLKKDEDRIALPMYLQVVGFHVVWLQMTAIVLTFPLSTRLSWIEKKRWFF